MVAPASQFDAIIAKIFGKLSHLGKWQVGPLAGKQRDRSGHAANVSKSEDDSRDFGPTE
jgi:hypothetical protein